jgi:hypothetical protein
MVGRDTGLRIQYLRVNNFAATFKHVVGMHGLLLALVLFLAHAVCVTHADVAVCIHLSSIPSADTTLTETMVVKQFVPNFRRTTASSDKVRLYFVYVRDHPYWSRHKSFLKSIAFVLEVDSSIVSSVVGSSTKLPLFPINEAVQQAVADGAKFIVSAYEDTIFTTKGWAPSSRKNLTDNPGLFRVGVVVPTLSKSNYIRMVAASPLVNDTSVVVLVISARSSVHKRNGIRASWARGLKNVFFMVGGSTCMIPPSQLKLSAGLRLGCQLQEGQTVSAVQQSRWNDAVATEDAALALEAKTHGDLIILPMSDYYTSLPEKM